MLNAMKHTLSKSTPAILSEKFPLEAAEDAEAGNRLLEGWTEASVTRLKGEIDAERQTIAQAQEHLGECIVGGVETTTAADALLRAENRLHALESQLTIARQKHELALADRKDAKRQLQRECLRKQLTELDDAAPPIQETIDRLTSQIAIVASLMDALRR